MAEKKSPDSEFDQLPSPQDFCLTVPLYQQFRFNEDREYPFIALEDYEGNLDCFCHGCGRHTVFNRLGKGQCGAFNHLHNHVFVLWFACSRDKNHKAIFVFRSHQGILAKIGQYPSIADLATPDLQKYRSVLGDEGFRELTRAVGLASHGVGVGAFVYLRRIFETLIERARQAAASEPGWDESAFPNARMDEKIVMLKHHLPKFLVENRSLYSIMSVGVHTFSEAECLAAFPVVRVGIELILDEHLESHTREKKIAAATKGISALGSALKSK
ncbi:MAG: short-chain dehydrogenase [Nitrospinae bacterium]|nr:short-chain dehydrogenase [Nitrospinota bacterium]